ncbi:MAG: translational machinery protein [Alphaproteobacteria bacterium]|nr:translational machinery protein [Alphaproteobacteria bacterium]
MPHFHAVIWLDHREAKVFRFNAENAEKTALHAHDQHHHLHHGKGHLMGRRSAPDQEFLDSILSAAKDAHEILVVGPGSAKMELIKHAHQKEPALAERLVGVETIDHPTDNQILAHARTYFERRDHLMPQR